ncbi:MAG: hypothetical protein NT088_02040 [Candidatus Omnitrophica bacterium]|nr:hypothetical protein [Candidatus Omnitrophota bacterium]
MDKSQTKIFWSLFIVCSLMLGAWNLTYGQGDDLELSIDVNSATTPLPDIYKPNIDLSGRGFNRDATWPQTLAAEEVINAWEKGVGLNNTYRMQYNLWEISQTRDAETRDKLRANYEGVIKKISDAKGRVILNLFGMPAGLGKALDKKSSFKDFRVFKAYVKDVIRYLSCEKKYNIWYEVWNAPDLDDFFLGRQQDYLLMYRAVAEAAKELKRETGVSIPVGGPSVSAWFRDTEGVNTALTPERSLIYALIKYCYSYHLPLDFISWHGYSSNPKHDQERTVYRKDAISLIRDWLTYFRFDRNTPLIVDEWNFDRNTNLLTERSEDSFIAASFIPARIKGMSDAGLSSQVYFALEDFENKNEGVIRNIGAFYFTPDRLGYKGGAKLAFNVFIMLDRLGRDMFPASISDEFCQAIASKSENTITVLAYNYLDPDIARNYLSKNIAGLNSAQIRSLLDIVKSDKLQKILQGEQPISALNSGAKVRSMLEEARRLNELVKKLSAAPRRVKLNFKNLKGEYALEEYKADSSCKKDCNFVPDSSKDISAQGSWEEDMALEPYSVHLIVLRAKPKSAEPANNAEAPKKEEAK